MVRQHMRPILPGRSFQAGHLFSARRAPGGPEVEEHRSSPPTRFSDRLLVAKQRLLHQTGKRILPVIAVSPGPVRDRGHVHCIIECPGLTRAVHPQFALTRVGKKKGPNGLWAIVHSAL